MATTERDGLTLTVLTLANRLRFNFNNRRHLQLPVASFNVSVISDGPAHFHYL